MVFEIMPLMFALLSIGEFFSDMVFVLKIFVLLTIISWVIMHLGKGPLSIVLIIGISWFVLFDAFWLFGGTYVLMMLLTLGIAGIFSQGGVNQRINLFRQKPGRIRKLPPPM